MASESTPNQSALLGETFLSAVNAPGKDSEYCKTFIFRKEGHTLGNALRSIITNYPDVVFCGYSLPHPAEDVMHFRIQSQGATAIQVLTRGFEDLSKVCDEVESRFNDAMKDFEQHLPEPSGTSSSGTFAKPKPVS